MPRRPRLAAGDLAYHVLNRRVGRLPLLDKPPASAAPTLTTPPPHLQRYFAYTSLVTLSRSPLRGTKLPRMVHR